MSAGPPVRVIVVDDDPQVQADLEEMLEPWGYDVRAAQGRGEALIRASTRLANRFRPHIAIVDLCLWDDCGPDRSGLKVIEAFQSAHCILYSAFLSFEVLRQVRSERVTWISKAESPQKLVDAIESASRQVCARCSELRVYAPEGWSPRKVVKTIFPAHDLPPPDVVEDLLRHLFPTSRTVTLEFIEDTDGELGPVGRGRSMVTKVWRDDKINPLVLKLGPAKRIKQEVDNYGQHIDGNVGGLFYAGIQDQPRYFWDLGGVLYTFLGTPSHNLNSFAHHYRTHHDPNAILWPLHHLLTEVWGHFYRASGPHTEPLFAAYDGVLRLRKRLEGDVAQSLRWPLHLRGIPTDLPHPIRWVQQHKDAPTIPRTRLAITHGDLHGDNLFVDPDHAWVIDFERSGPGPILRDVTELEVDILTRLIASGNTDLGAYYTLVLALASPSRPDAPIPDVDGLDADSELAKALHIIQGLRTLAQQVIVIQDQREYLWGLLLDALFVASLRATPTIQRDRALILSAVLCRRLERWEESTAQTEF
jgi:CheY-like chemotaxis protein